jgi:pre-mRNA-splicing factor RBM22/SLT11
MASIKRDDVKQNWEGDTEFPLVCETCLGDNPYVRMTKEAHGKKCKVCENPFTVFAWQAGTKGRLKRVEICRSCAQAKNVCQVCIYDLQYGLPVKVRDRVMRESGSAGAVSAVPQSNANRAWYTAQQQRALQQGETVSTNELAHAKLTEMARMEPAYERNLPKLCSFFARGECDRGANCPFRHELPRDRNDPMAKQNTKDRFFGQSDPVANKILGRKRRQEIEQAKADEDHEKARATAYLRFQGDAPYPELTEPDVRDKFYSFGEIVGVRFQPDKGQAFVEYTQPEAAELAIASMNRKELLGRQIYCSWARAPKRGDTAVTTTTTNDRQQHQSSAPTVVPAPPGGGTTKKLKALPNVTVKPPPEVAAIAAARKAGGGAIRGVGASQQAVRPSSKPYYPSSDPSRLGSKGSPSS